MKVLSPEKKGLKKIYESSTRLEKKDSDILHSIVEKLLWVAKRGRPDIDTAIYFLCTRVNKRTKEDKDKFSQVLKYLKHTIDNKSIMVADSLRQLFPWVDSTYGVHPNLKIHTGACKYFGYGMVHCKSRKQKLNTKSSTAAEVVGVSD